jgi:hypothetical protein
MSCISSSIPPSHIIRCYHNPYNPYRTDRTTVATRTSGPNRKHFLILKDCTSSSITRAKAGSLEELDDWDSGSEKRKGPAMTIHFNAPKIDDSMDPFCRESTPMSDE